MRKLARSLPLFALLGVACFFQDGGPSASGSALSNTDGAPTTGPPTGTTGTAMTGGSTSDATTSAPDCEPLYVTDFSADPASDWTIFSPTWLWNPVDGTFQGKTTDMVGAGAQLTAGMWQDFTLQVRLRLGPTSYGGVVLRAADQFAGDFLYIQLDSTDGDLEGFRANSMDPVFSFAGLVAPNTWPELVVRFQGTSLAIAYNGTQIATGVQIDGLGAGGIGLIVLNGSMDVDAITVCPP